MSTKKKDELPDVQPTVKNEQGDNVPIIPAIDPKDTVVSEQELEQALDTTPEITSNPNPENNYDADIQVADLEQKLANKDDQIRRLTYELELAKKQLSGKGEGKPEETSVDELRKKWETHMVKPFSVEDFHKYLAESYFPGSTGFEEIEGGKVKINYE